jgi:hypothetical protein
MSGQTQAVAIPARAVPWTRKESEGILRIVGDAEPILKGHLNEIVKVTAVRWDGTPFVTFRGVVRGYRTQGKCYLVIYFPRRLMPMWPTIKDEAGENGIPLLIELTGLKAKPRGGSSNGNG